jgi:hypothetical protein
MADYHFHAGDVLERKRIMVVGKDVATVQRVSRAYLAHGADVFPYYGLLNLADVELFDPHLLVLCLPLSDNFLLPTNRPYLVWSDHPAIAAPSLRSDLLPQAS